MKILTVREMFCAARILRNFKYPGFWLTAKPRYTVLRQTYIKVFEENHALYDILIIYKLLI